MQGQQIDPDLLEAIMKTTDAVKEELSRNLLKTSQMSIRLLDCGYALCTGHDVRLLAPDQGLGP